MRYQPMLASPMSRGLDAPINGWAVAEKLDGHRLLVEVTWSVMAGKSVKAFARPRGGDKRMLRRDLPADLVASLARLEPGVYDGELHIPGGSSHDVTRLDKAGQLIFTAFDILERAGHTLVAAPYRERRDELFTATRHAGTRVRLTSPQTHDTLDAVMAHFRRVREAGGEGLILKRLDSRYEGKRSKAWVKLKQLFHARLTVIGFEAGKLGPFSKVVLHDVEHDVTTTVKTVDDEQRASFAKDARRVFGADADLTHPAVLAPSIGARRRHPAIGRLLWIEHQSRLPSGQFRHPMWDRWDDE